MALKHEYNRSKLSNWLFLGIHLGPCNLFKRGVWNQYQDQLCNNQNR